MKKIIMTIVLAVLIFNPVSAKAESINSGIELQSKDNVWKYRIYNGRTQRRLWDNYKKTWLSDWMYV